MTSTDPTRPSRLRLAVVLSHPVQYYAPWFRHLAAQPYLDPTVLYLESHDPRHDPEFGKRGAWDRDLLSGYRSIILPNRAPVRDVSRFGGLFNPGIAHELDRRRYDAIVVFGYASASALLTLLVARARGIPVLLRGDSHDLGRVPSSASILRARLVFRLCSGFLSSGSANAAYLRKRGVAPNRIFPCPHAVDAAWFNPDRPGLAAEARKVRETCGATPNAPLVLFAGKWVEKKQPVALAKAFLEVAPPDARLLFVGDGDQRPQLEAIAASDNRIHLLGFINQSALPQVYLAADVFALPSRGAYETWGLAVNEAMQLGVPCLVSDVVGCQPDLVIPGETGWVCEAENEGSLASTLAAALADVRQDRVAWAQRVRARIALFSYERATDSLQRALASTVRQ